MIIVIDDDPFIRELCKILLRKNQKDLSIHHSAEDFFNQNWKPGNDLSIFLIDEQLPGMSGVQLAGKLRTQFQQPKVKLIAMTGKLPNKGTDNPKERYFDDYLLKPFTEESLMRAVSVKGQNVEEKPNALYENDGEIPDLDILYKMAGYDPKLVALFVDQFIADSERDKGILLRAMENNEIGKVIETSHKMAGRCSQIGAYGLGAAFRCLEFELRKNIFPLSEMSDEVLAVIKKLDATMNFFSKSKAKKPA